MALNVGATCIECGEHVTLAGREITCRVALDGRTGTYEFICPMCGQLSCTFMGPEVCRLLKTAIGITWIYPPAELDEVHLGPALTEDDLLEFGLALHGTDDATILARAVL